MEHLLDITAVTEPFPEGQKCIAAALRFDRDISDASISPETFSVRGRTVTRAYANTAPERAGEGADGPYVILELSRFDPDAATVGLMGRDRDCRAYMRRRTLVVGQCAPVLTVSGETLQPTGETVCSTRTQNLIADEFQQGEFEGLKYNLFVPRDYVPERQYPLVLFIEDAWGCGQEHEIALAQGLGAVVWAGPEEQAKHPCFVLAPQYPGPRIVDENFAQAGNEYFVATGELETTKRLLDSIIQQWSIDRDRIYATGQSMGCMASCELNIRYPGFFAASLLVAGPWNPITMVSIRDENLWVFVDRGDELAYIFQSASMAGMEAAGGRLARYNWDARIGRDALNGLAAGAAEDDYNLKFTVFDKDSCVPDDLVGDISGPHRGTWRVVYDLEAVRDWLFRNKRGAKKHEQ